MDTKSMSKIMDEYLEEQGIAISWTFIPKSKSRYPSWEALNWKASIKYRGRMILEDVLFSQGSAHCTFQIPWGKPRKISDLRALQSEMEDGIVYATQKRVKPPEAIDLIWCLVSDCRILNSPGFEDWAGDMGMDIDSRKAFDIYTQCLENSLKFKNYLPSGIFSHLQQLTEDY